MLLLLLCLAASALADVLLFPSGPTQGNFGSRTAANALCRKVARPAGCGLPSALVSYVGDNAADLFEEDGSAVVGFVSR